MMRRLEDMHTCPLNSPRRHHQALPAVPDTKIAENAGKRGAQRFGVVHRSEQLARTTPHTATRMREDPFDEHLLVLHDPLGTKPGALRARDDSTSKRTGDQYERVRQHHTECHLKTS